jgi:hypothetical protein
VASYFQFGFNRKDLSVFQLRERFIRLQICLHVCVFVVRSPQWSGDRSSWLQIQRSGFNSRRYQTFREVVVLERFSLSSVSTIEVLLERKFSDSGLDSRKYGRRDPSRDHVAPSIRSLADSGNSICSIVYYYYYYYYYYYGYTTICWSLASFSVSWSYTQSVGLLDMVPAGHETSLPTQDNTDIHASSGMRTHDLSVWAGEDSSCLEPRAATVIGNLIN